MLKSNLIRLIPSLFDTPYYRKMKQLFGTSIIAYWPLWDLAGSVATDVSGNGRNGTYTGVGLGYPGIGDGHKAPYFDAGSDYVNVYSAGLAAAFNGAAGTIVIWTKVYNAAVWADGNVRVAYVFKVDDNNYLQLHKHATGGMRYTYAAGGVVIQITLDETPTTWMCTGLTWSKADDKVKAFYNGAQVGATRTGLGTWAGSPGAANTMLGAFSATPNYMWNGYLSHGVLINRKATQSEMMKPARWIVCDSYPGTVFFGDSIFYGTGASDEAHTCRALITAAKGWKRTFNSGLGGTTLQNTVQNTVATIGGAVDSNGRDTYQARITDYYPTDALVLYGLNDLRLNDAAYSVALFQNDLGEIVDNLILANIKPQHIVIGSPTYMNNYAAGAPWNGGSTAKHVTHVAACAAVAAAKGTKYIDVYQWMIDHGGDALIGGDGIHPNDAGHQAIANAFLTVL